MARQPRLDEKVTDDLKQYVRMRIDAVKLELVEDLSGLAGGAIRLIVMLLLCLLALMLFTGALVYALNLLINHMVWSAVIVGGIYVILGIVIFMSRKAFSSMMVGTFSKMFFKKKKKEDDDED